MILGENRTQGIANNIFGHRSVLQVAKCSCIILLAYASTELSIRFHSTLSGWEKKVQVNRNMIRNRSCLGSQFC